MPRTLKSLPWPKLLTVTLGIANWSASTLVTPLLARSLPVRTEPETAVVIRFSARRWAVTMISGVASDALLSALSSAAGGGVVCAAASPQHANASADALIH